MKHRMFSACKSHRHRVDLPTRDLRHRDLRRYLRVRERQAVEILRHVRRRVRGHGPRDARRHQRLDILRLPLRASASALTRRRRTPPRLPSASRARSRLGRPPFPRARPLRGRPTRAFPAHHRPTDRSIPPGASPAPSRARRTLFSVPLRPVKKASTARSRRARRARHLPARRRPTRDAIGARRRPTRDAIGARRAETRVGTRRATARGTTTRGASRAVRFLGRARDESATHSKSVAGSPIRASRVARGRFRLVPRVISARSSGGHAMGAGGGMV